MELRIILPALMLAVAASLSGAVDQALKPAPGPSLLAVDGGFALLKMAGPDGRSPALAWTAPPESARGLAIVAEDLDAPSGQRVFWALWGLSPTVRYLEAGVPEGERTASGGRQGRLGGERAGYSPPSFAAAARHRLRVTLFVLDRELRLADDATGDEVARAARRDAIEAAEWFAGGGWLLDRSTAVTASR
jgi:phosphatidylethanolamine-binding protein (PEBP) family uncharacterized protein